MKDKKIAAVVVTYNRKEVLAVCLSAICNQVFKPHCVYIMDNASTDGTDTWIKENNYDGIKDSIDFRYVRLTENIGGSGGFHTGMKMAYESCENFDGIWVMDDDGIPDKMQLKNLVAHMDEYDYLASFVVAQEDPNLCAFESCSVKEFEAEAEGGLIQYAASPFNGILYSRKLISIVGYPVRDMFIWGDEWNYHLRCVKSKFYPAVVVAARHIHPKDKQIRKKMIFNRYAIPEPDWKLYAYTRNEAYNNRTLSRRLRHSLKVTVYEIIDYTYYFTFVEFSWRKLAIVYRAIYDGFNKNLSRLGNYKKA